MPASTIATEHPTTIRNPAVVSAEPAPASRRRSGGPLVAMIGGLAVMVAAATLIPAAVRTAGPDHTSAPAATAPTAPADPLAITLSARDVAVVSQVYEPGQQSGWHAHTGIHAVAVLSGTVTVYDSGCRAETFGPGRPYVGGQEPHLVRNETEEPVVMSVTYLAPSDHAASSRKVAPPAGCPVG
jgi:quercetin dioxygenase-like cupin family protein